MIMMTILTLQCPVVLKRQRLYVYIGQETRIKGEPVCAVSGSRQNTKESWGCGAGDFTLGRLPNHAKDQSRSVIIAVKRPT